jgi:hypothetical protein
MEPQRSLDKFFLRAIEQQLGAELQQAKQHARMAVLSEEKRATSESLDCALRRFIEFVLRKAIPGERERSAR